MIDLTPQEFAVVRDILAHHLPGVEVRAFGSRVNATAGKTSDLDLALMTDRPLSLASIGRLRDAFSESDLPFRVDLIDWSAIGEEFREVIRESSEALVEDRKKNSGKK